MEKYIDDLKQKYAALDKEVEGRIKEFLTNAVRNKWNICVDVNLHNGEVARVSEIRLFEDKVIYIQSELESELNCGDMEFGEVLKVLSCLPDNETFSRLNGILERDSLYEINDKLLKSLPLYKQNLDRIVKFEIINRSLLLTDKQGKIGAYSKKDEIDSFIKYMNNAKSSMEIRADFFRIMSNIMDIDDIGEIWNHYKEEIIDDIRECSDEEYNDSNVCIAISNLLKAKLLYE